jgi:hypothetical protein
VSSKDRRAALEKDGVPQRIVDRESRIVGEEVPVPGSRGKSRLVGWIARSSSLSLFVSDSRWEGGLLLLEFRTWKGGRDGTSRQQRNREGLGSPRKTDRGLVSRKEVECVKGGWGIGRRGSSLSGLSSSMFWGSPNLYRAFFLAAISDSVSQMIESQRPA